MIGDDAVSRHVRNLPEEYVAVIPLERVRTLILGRNRLMAKPHQTQGARDIGQ